MNGRSTNHDWLALTVEEPLEPELPICDPHHHLWDWSTVPASQVNSVIRVMPRYLLNEILQDVGAGHNVVSTVFLECGAMYKTDGPEALRSVGETEFVNGVAAMSASGLYGKTRIAAGIVGTADLCLGDGAGAVLDAQITAGGDRFRGVRHSAALDADPALPRFRINPPEHLYRRDDFRRGFAQLAPRRLTFDAWCYDHQIPDVTALARAFPDTTIILNHFGGPLGVGAYAGRADEVYAEWRTSITDLATCPNVIAKLGGINMAINGFGWHEQPRPPSSQELCDATRHYYEFTIDQFGADRCMFESNFPVDMVTCSYLMLWNSFKRLTANASATEKAKLFHDTAARVYRLADPV